MGVAATVEIGGVGIPDIAVMLAVMVAIGRKWGQLRIDVRRNVGGVSLWLITS